MKLEIKIVLLVTGIVLSIGIFLFALVDRPVHEYMENDLKGKGVILAHTLSELITDNVINREVYRVFEAINNVQQTTKELEYIYVIGFDGAVISHTFTTGFPKDLKEMLHDTASEGSPVFRRFRTDKGPILDVEYGLIKGMKGRIHIGMNEAQIHTQISTIRNRIAVTTLGIVALGLIVGFILSWHIVRPLDQLATSMQAFGEGKTEREIVVQGGGWEVEQLASSFNHMIADRKRMEHALRENEERYRMLFENNPHPMLVYDLETFAILDVNDAAIHQYGYSKEEFLSLTILDLRPPEDIPVLLETFKNEGLNKAGDRRHRKKDGTIIHVETTSHSLKFGDRRASVVLVYDITERKKLEQEMAKAEKMESLGILAGGIAHDFNNLLTAILGNISIAKFSIAPTDKVYDRITDAEKASLRARDLTQQLLTFSTGGAPIKKTISINELISDSACFSLRGSGARCDLSVARNLFLVDADEGQLSQVINNLVINARQAMPNGGTIHITCENVKIARDQLPLEKGSYVHVSIRDEGVGIPPENLERIFEPFFTTKPKGSGLGLATSYSIIKNHGGHITVDSAVGVGTTFHIYLPTAADRKRTRKRNLSERAICGSGKILFMDDERVVRDVAGEMLASLGYEVEFAQDGLEAIEHYKHAMHSNKPFDVVIMDLTVPGGMGGQEAVKRLSEIDPDARVIVSSGYSNDPIMAEFATYGFKGVVTKPYTIKNLGEAIQAILAPVNS